MCSGQATRPVVLLAATLVALSGCFGDDDSGQLTQPTTSTRPHRPADVHVSADLAAKPQSPPSMSGFLHGLTPGSPPDSLVLPLRPRLWRSVPARAPIELVARLGARYQLVLSDLWGYPPTGWGGHGPPWEHLERWARLVRRTARTLRGRGLEWDVWNEPDNPDFWTGTREQFFRVYEAAARALTAELGESVVVGGPSTTKATPAWLEGLLRDCREHGCRVSFLSFHANLQPWEPIPALTGRLRRLRDELLPRYRDLSLARIEVNESVGPVDQYRPGEILGFLHHMEAGGADAAARSCWPDLHGSDNCSNGTFEGLLTPTHEPRSAWWAYRAYADGVDTRVPSRSDSAAVAALASVRVGGRAQVLLGRLDRARPDAGPLQVGLRLTGLDRALAGADRAIVSVRLLPDSGEAPLPVLAVVERQTLPVSAGELSLDAGALRPHQALIVTVAPG
jgi:xylan 1,4-beta-xylosidase